MMTDEEVKDAIDTMVAKTLSGQIEAADGLRELYRAGYAAGLEAAAKVVDEHRGPIEICNHHYPPFLACAAAIRALKESP